LADVSINTVPKFLVDAGTACAAYQNGALRNLPCKRVQVDEIWAFCYAWDCCNSLADRARDTNGVEIQVLMSCVYKYVLF
jgi:hypothetical protein